VSSPQLLALRDLLEQRFPDAAPLVQRVAPPVATGLPELDRVLPGGGLPRGKLTAWGQSGGASAVLRAACQSVVAAGWRAAWIDAEGTIGAEWQEGPLLVRPVDPLRRINALRSAEVLLASGGFTLVVLSAGADPEGTERVRLTRAAREGNSAFVALTENPSLAALRVSSRILPHSFRWERGPFLEPAAPVEATVEVLVRTLGWNARASVVLPVAAYELRLSLDPTLADRRGCGRKPGTRRRGRSR
jgi:fermentation-respiration switch protein FrsA (DUF1100 family)